MFTKQHEQDYNFILLVGVLLVFGLVMLSSAGAFVAYQKFGDSYYFLKHQILVGVVPGLIIGYLLSRIHYQRWKKFAAPFLLFSIVLLILVFIPGLSATHNTGTKSWIELGGFSLQPSELVKLSFLLYLASWFEKRSEHDLKDFFYGFLPFVFLLGIIMLLMALQPDIGTMSIIIVIAMSVFFVAGAKWRHVITLVLAGFALFAFLIKIAPYRLARFTTFLHPEVSLQGIGYHMHQAFLAIGSGGWLGRGFGQSRQKFNYLPEVVNDSIFAIIAEELGFLLTSGFLLLYAWIVYKGFQIAAQAPDIFGKLLATGIVTWFVFQGFVNVGAMVGVLPITGIPLPFVSFGGTAMMVNLAAVGLLLNISKYTK